MDTLPPNLRALRATLLGLIAVALMLLGYLGYRAFFERRTPSVEPRAIAPRGALAEDEQATIDLFKQTAPSVVFITTIGRGYDLRMRAVEVQAGTGSGFIWDDAGDIVTNFHVVQRVLRNPGSSGIRVTLSNHQTYDARVVGFAAEFDLAVVRINAPREKLTPILIGSSSDLQVGQKCFAIGNPFGLDQTLTTGVISATGRSIPGVAGNLIEDVIQTDAAINPGNSGGPLLDSAGRLIGVNTQIASPSGASAGIGFAVPVDTVNRVVPQLIESGRIVRPRIGVSLDDRISQNLTSQMGVSGVMILGVQPGSTAERAGLRGLMRSADGRLIPGDVIQQIDGQTVTNTQQFLTILGKHALGDRVTLKIHRGGKEMDVEIVLDDDGQTPR